MDVRNMKAWRVLHIVGDFVRAIDHLDKQGWVHRDPSPSNMMWVEAGQFGARGVLVDLNTAVAANRADTDISGTALVRAYRFDESAEQRHTAASDIESVYISLLYVLSSGQALPWRHLNAQQIMRAVKGITRFDPANWYRAHRYCPAEYRPALERLHTAIYRGSVEQYIMHPVTAREVLQILVEESMRLGRTEADEQQLH